MVLQWTLKGKSPVKAGHRVAQGLEVWELPAYALTPLAAHLCARQLAAEPWTFGQAQPGNLWQETDKETTG